MPLTVKDIMKSNYVGVNEDSSIKDAVGKMVANEANIILIKKNKEVIGIISRDEIYNVFRINDNIQTIKVNKIMSSFFNTIDVNYNLDNEFKSVINGKNVKVLIVKSNNGEILGIISKPELILAFSKHILKIIQNHRNQSRQVRHDLRGSLFTINTSIALIEKNPEKLTQVLEIMKKTLISMNNLIEEWKKSE
jgi:signal-transduction protein with cAMP-binding, CBS, and nucleotidyltransferase domain